MNHRQSEMLKGRQTSVFPGSTYGTSSDTSGETVARLAMCLHSGTRGGSENVLVLTVSSFLALGPGLVLLRWWTGIDGSWLPALLPPAAFTGLVLTLVAALAHDRTAGTSPEVER